MQGTVDAVYILGEGSKYKDEEIRYSIRSLCMHVSNLRRLCIVGKLPAFLKVWRHIPFASPFPCKDANIAGAMLLACRDPKISDPFLCCHDDHFMLLNYDAATFPAWYRGKVFRSSNKRYDHDLKSAEAILIRYGIKDPVSFETHTPILIHKTDMIRAFRAILLERDCFTAKSIYANQCDKLKKEYVEDYKIKPPDIDWSRLKGRPCFSVSPEIPENVWTMLKRLYPKPSPFEKDQKK